MTRKIVALVILHIPVHALAAPPKEVHEPVPVVAPIPGPVYLHAGPLVGHVSDSTAHLWAKGSNAARLSFRIGQSAEFSDARTVTGPDLDEAASFTGQVQVDGLQPETRYYYVPVLDDAVAMAP